MISFKQHLEEAFCRANFNKQLKKKGIDVDKRHKDNVKDAAAAKKRSAAAAKDHAAFRKKYPNIKFEAKDPGEYDNEGSMAKTQLRGVLADAEHMIGMFEDDENLPEWVQNKITKAADYLNSAHRYMMNNGED